MGILLCPLDPLKDYIFDYKVKSSNGMAYNSLSTLQVIAVGACTNGKSQPKCMSSKILFHAIKLTFLAV